jgi:hypothetical protein
MLVENSPGALGRALDGTIPEKRIPLPFRGPPVCKS